MPAKKYDDFTESEPVEKIAKQGAKSANDLRKYVAITCPHCNDAFIEITVSSLSTNKASECRDHLRDCKTPGAKADPRRPSDATTTIATTNSTTLVVVPKKRVRGSDLATRVGALEDKLQGFEAAIVSVLPSLESHRPFDIPKLKPLMLTGIDEMVACRLHAHPRIEEIDEQRAVTTSTALSVSQIVCNVASELRAVDNFNADEVARLRAEVVRLQEYESKCATLGIEKESLKKKHELDVEEMATLRMELSSAKNDIAFLKHSDAHKQAKVHDALLSDIQKAAREAWERAGAALSKDDEAAFRKAHPAFAPFMLGDVDVTRVSVQIGAPDGDDEDELDGMEGAPTPDHASRPGGGTPVPGAAPRKRAKAAASDDSGNESDSSKPRKRVNKSPPVMYMPISQADMQRGRR